MKTKEEVILAISNAKKTLDRAQGSMALMAAINKLSHLTWLLSIFEADPSNKVNVCVFGIAPVAAAKDAAKVLADQISQYSHLKAWPTCEPNELVVFPVDNADLIEVLNALENRGYKVRIENKE